MSVKHTPGPWLWRWKDNSLRTAGDGKPYQYGTEVVLRLAEDAEISDADERLIAAAPDLLAALHQIDALRASGGKSDAEMLFEMRSVAKAAIAKATGDAA